MSVSDLRAAARRRLPPFLFHYLDGAANSELTARRNVSELQSISLRQRVLVDVSSVDLSTELFGSRVRLPIGLAPVGLAGMYARRGEVQAARAARSKRIPMCLSTVSLCPLAEVAAVGCPDLWFQLYVIRDRGFMRDLLASAGHAGCNALIFTVDMPLPGERYRDARSGMSGPGARWRRYVQAMLHPRWAWDVGLLGRPHQLGNVVPVLGDNSGLEVFIGWLAADFDPTVTWKDLDWIREHWDGPLILKGILDVDDARSAVSLGADGIVVSNHGGPAARRRPGLRECAAADRDGGSRSSHVARRRWSPLGSRRRATAGARRQRRPPGSRLRPRSGRGRRTRRSSGPRPIEKKMRIAMALTGTRTLAQLGPSSLAR